MKYIIVPILSFLIACNGNNRTNEKARLPSLIYNYVKIDTAALAYKHAVYVPVYSHIYTEAGTSLLVLASTLSVRNTSFTDSFYVTDVIYYGSQGEILQQYLRAPVLVKPMTSIEFVVERTETKGGAGANFVVKWGALKAGMEPVIQTVMVETATGISFVTNGINIQ